MMSKKSFFRSTMAFLLLFAVSTHVGAQEISVDAARQAAASFLKSHAAKLPAKSRKGMMKAPPAASQLQLVYTQEDQLHKSPALYVFEQPKQGGFIIASADERAYPILGYNEIGTFREDSLPCCLKFILEEYGKQIAEARKQNLPRHTEKTGNESWQNIEPLLTCAWHQRAPFNNLCPIDKYTGERCATGCVATAMAQIMYYWKWPERGVGSYSYQTDNVEGTLTANFEETTYRWDLMKDVYKAQRDENGNRYYDDPEDAVATLMYHCGVALNMGYSSSGSGAGDIAKPLKKYFNYSHAISRIDCDFENKFYDELSHGRPVKVSGSLGNGFHGYVCDGYRTDGFFHFNMGWGAGENGYYKIYAVADHRSYVPATEFANGYKSRVATIRIAPKSEDILDSNGNVYEQLDGEAFLVDAQHAEGHLEIPSHVTSSNGTVYPVTGISGNAVAGNNNITSVTIPNTVTAIVYWTFAWCTKLTTITIPNSVKSINWWAFYHTPALSAVKIYNTNPSAIIVDGGAFDGIKEDCILYVPKGCAEKYREANAEWRKFTNIVDNLDVEGDDDDDDGSVITQDRIMYKIGSGKASIIGNETSGDIVIPESITDKDGNRYSVTEIQDGAFLENYDITSVVLPNTIATIGYRAFSRCNNLTSITIPNSVTSIKSGAFLGCINLSSIIIPNSITTIENQTCMGCYGLTSVTIPSSVTSIGDAAFDECRSLAKIICYATTPPKCGTWCFSRVDKNTCELSVPMGCKSAYQQAWEWEDFSIINEDLPTGVTEMLNDHEQRINDALYSVDGKKQNGEPTKPGLYIRNGKKVVK